jgi:hypothetical protein
VAGCWEHDDKIWVLYKARNFLTSWATVNCSARTMLCGVSYETYRHAYVPSENPFLTGSGRTFGVSQKSEWIQTESCCIKMKWFSTCFHLQTQHRKHCTLILEGRFTCSYATCLFRSRSRRPAERKNEPCNPYKLPKRKRRASFFTALPLRTEPWQLSRYSAWLRAGLSGF